MNRLNAVPKPPKNPVESSQEPVNQVEVIEGVLGKLKARTEAANNDAHVEKEPDAEAKEIFDEIFMEVDRLRVLGDQEELQHYLSEIHDRYFASSNDLFSQLSLKDNFEILLKINKVDELQGPIGQAGVGQLVLRLASYQYEKPDRSTEKVGSFVEELLKDKNISDAVNVLTQLQTVAAQGLANGDWSRPVYDGILNYLETRRPADVFIVAKLKDRLSQRLREEESDPTMGVITTIDNKHQGLMFEDSVFDDKLNAKLNDSYSFGTASKVRVSQISRDYLGIFDTRNRLISLASAKAVDMERTRSEKADGLIGIDTYSEAAKMLRSRKHVFNKTLDLFFKKIVNLTEDTDILEKFAEVSGISPSELSDSLQNEMTYHDLYEKGQDVSEEVAQKSDAFYAKLKSGNFTVAQMNALEDTLYDVFNKKFAARKSEREKVDVLDLTQQEGLDFLGLDKSNIELFKVLQDPYFTRTIQETFGVKLSALDIRAQSAFLSYFAKATERDVKDFSQLINTFAEGDRLKICSAYLAFEKDEHFGYIVEKLCERPDVALPVMNVVYDLVGNAGQIEDFLLSEFKTGNDHAVIASLYEKLIRKARDVLLKYNAKTMEVDTMAEIAGGSSTLAEYPEIAEEFGIDISDVPERIKSCEQAEQRLVKEAQEEITKLNVGQTLFLNAFKSLKDEGVALMLENITSAEFDFVNSQNISLADKEAIRELYKKCHVAAKDSEEYLNELLATNDRKLDDPNVNFYLLKYKGELKGMMRFDETVDKESGAVVSLYAGGLVMSPDFEGHRIADSIINQTFAEQRSRGLPISAHVKTDSPLALRYLSGDFICDRIESLGGVDRLHIILEPLDKVKPSTKALPVEEVIQKAGTRSANQTFTAFDSVPHPADIPSGFVMTCFIKQDGKYYVAFERVSSDEVALAA